MEVLSKTGFIRHTQCPTRLSLDQNTNPAEDRSIDEDQHSKVLSHYRQDGYRVEDYAEMLFPEGVRAAGRDEVL